jgi:centractin
VAEKDAKTKSKMQYQLPDGQLVLLSLEQYELLNVLFDPLLFGSEELGAANILINLIMKSNIDLQAKLFHKLFSLVDQC